MWDLLDWQWFSSTFCGKKCNIWVSEIFLEVSYDGWMVMVTHVKKGPFCVYQI